MEGGALRTAELSDTFYADDYTGLHETGPAVEWTNRLTLKHRFFDAAGGQKLELRAAPPATIRYATDGSDPKVAGATYDGPFPLPEGAQFVLAYAEADGLFSAVERYPVPRGGGEVKLEIDKSRPTDWSRRHAYTSTRDSYEFLTRLKKHGATISGVGLTVIGEGGDQGWAELQFYERMRLTPEQIEKCLEAMREAQTSGQVQLTATELHLPTGQALLDWVEEVKLTLKAGDFRQ
jgi:hypothetical protein